MPRMRTSQVSCCNENLRMRCFFVEETKLAFFFSLKSAEKRDPFLSDQRRPYEGDICRTMCFFAAYGM